MSTAADKIRERAARIASRQAAATEESLATPEPTAPSSPPPPSTEGIVFPPRSRPVRRTVDLGPAEHDRLDVWQRETARQLGRARITGQDVLRALVVRLITDEELSRKIRTDLQAQR